MNDKDKLQAIVSGLNNPNIFPRIKRNNIMQICLNRTEVMAALEAHFRDLFSAELELSFTDMDFTNVRNDDSAMVTVNAKISSNPSVQAVNEVKHLTSENAQYVPKTEQETSPEDASQTEEVDQEPPFEMEEPVAEPVEVPEPVEAVAAEALDLGEAPEPMDLSEAPEPAEPVPAGNAEALDFGDDAEELIPTTKKETKPPVPKEDVGILSFA